MTEPCQQSAFMDMLLGDDSRLNRSVSRGFEDTCCIVCYLSVLSNNRICPLSDDCTDMSDLLYVSVARFPTEKAHGLQIAQNCEAFAQAGYDVRLWVAGRNNTPAMRAVENPYTHYGIDETFRMEWLPVLDTYWLTGGKLALERLAFYLMIVSYVVVMGLRLLLQPDNRADVYYSRDEALLLALSLFLPADKLAYEAHLFSQTGGRLQQLLIGRVGHIIAITPRLHDDLIAQRGADPQCVIVAHDGFRRERFAHLPDSSTARRFAGWPDDDAFIVGFVGRLHMLNVDKGVGTLVKAAAQIPNVHLALVGGPDNMAEQFRQQWLNLGQDDARFLYTGQVAPDDVPRYLRAFAVCAMPHPFTEQFAYYTSPLKLFEYMAAGRAVIASDLPGWSDVLRHEQNALLVPSGDVTALADALQRLKNDATLRATLAETAQKEAFAHYTWQARAEHIRAHLQRNHTL